jgi:hypothetical protein
MHSGGAVCLPLMPMVMAAGAIIARAWTATWR